MTVFCYMLAFYYLKLRSKLTFGFWAELTFRFLREILYNVTSWHLPSFAVSLKKMWYLMSTPHPLPTSPHLTPLSERISMRQSKVDKLYAGLKDLAEERRGKLDERHRLFQLNREVDDLEQWIAEREVVAGSHELGQDYEHVTASNTSRTRVGIQHRVGCGRPFAFPVCEQRKHPRLESEVMGFHFS